jgi:hypothetical protein
MKNALSIIKSKTIVFSVILAVLGTIESQVGVLQPYMTKEVFGIISLTVASIIAVLRVITTTPLSEK